MIKIAVTVTNSFSCIVGFLQTNPDLTEDSAKELIKELIGVANEMKYLAIEHYDGSQTVFNKKILADSIMSYRIVDEKINATY